MIYSTGHLFGFLIFLLCGIIIGYFISGITKKEKKNTKIKVGNNKLNVSESGLYPVQYSKKSNFTRDVLKSIKSGLITLDLNMDITSSNGSARSILNAKETELEGQNIADFSGLIEIAEVIEQTVDSVPPFYHKMERKEIKIIDLLGKEVLVGFSVTPLIDSAERLTGYVLVFRNMTEIKELAEGMERKDRLAILGEMAAGVAHEIRNPLSSIMGYVSVIDEETEDNQSHKKYLSIVMQEIDRVSLVIQKILDFSRTFTPIVKNIDLEEFIAEIIELETCDLKKSNITISTDIKYKQKVFFDKELIKQILINLIQNSIFALRNTEQALIEISTLQIKDEALGRMIRISVQDNGSGIKEQNKEKIFKPFFTSKGNEGLGLGLSISARIAEDHNGKLSFESSGQGTIFNLDLPELKS